MNSHKKASPTVAPVKRGDNSTRLGVGLTTVKEPKPVPLSMVRLRVTPRGRIVTGGRAFA